MEEQLVPLKRVRELVGYSKQHIARLEADGRFPQRIKPDGPNSKCFWLQSEIQQYIADLKSRRDKKHQTPTK